MRTLYRDKLSGDIGYEVDRQFVLDVEMVTIQTDCSTVRDVPSSELELVSKQEFIDHITDMMECTIEFAAKVGFLVILSISDYTDV